MYKLFSLPGDFIVEYTQSGTAKIAPLAFTVEQQGMFRSFFAHVFYAPIYNLFYGLLVYIPGHSLGWAVIIITLLIRLVLLFPQHQMLVNNKKMQLIQPKIKEIQEKYK
jgi:membrane protein insertase Oxa1/YidC/SpoIIIJ